ncbi:hypothetical protein SRRS_49830 [Sporomusa rhizae]
MLNLALSGGDFVHQRKIMGCNNCIESGSCEFSSEFCPKASLDLHLENDLATDPVLKKYREYYQRLNN